MQPTSFHASAQSAFDPAPSIDAATQIKLAAATKVPASATCVGVAVATAGEVPAELGIDRTSLTAAGFEGKPGQTQIVPQKGGVTFVAFGIGPREDCDAATLRDATAAFARAANTHDRLAIRVDSTIEPQLAARAACEGAVLARYAFVLKRNAPAPKPLRELTIVGSPLAELERGVEYAGIATRAAELARDLANAPATLLTARRMAEIAEGLAKRTGLQIEVFDEHALMKLGCGGLLGVNAGSVEPPRMIKLTYKPKGKPTGRVALVAKGIMFDSGGLGLKPNDMVHATMKGDMSGAAAVLATMTALAAAGCTTEVTGYLMCTDNMPSGTAMKLGDVLTVRGGTTVEVINTDAEGRLVMADALVLATEQNPKPDAIVDIATLTGACQRALGVLRAGVFGNDPHLVDQIRRASESTDERVWELPLDRHYRRELDSNLADLKNVGGENAGAITAALFLEEFVAGLPWAHIDIAGTANLDAEETWRPKGQTGFGARLLLDLLIGFKPRALKQ